MKKDKDNKLKKKYGIETGSFEDGLTYARMGDKSEILINIEALQYKHEPPSGFTLKEFIKTANIFSDNYSVYLIGRRPNLPKNYLMPDMANDYATMIRREFKKPVDIMGISTGGQIAQYLAVDHPDVVRKLVILSAAYRISKSGAKIEKKAADYFEKGKVGKSLASTLDLVFSNRIVKNIAKFFVWMLGKKLLGEIQYPNDFLIETRADREMNLKERLKEIKAPTLLISGELDVCYNAADVRLMAEEIPNAKSIIYEKYGHSLTHSNRDEVNQKVLEFLKDE
ncbi:MAG: alpha/beta fold hydrolase [Candidatus Lokiarchaeota archaeon]|nr:alpha/beta fold hydrolase [Candidatus Lokiarchaeota archaeon]